jgi:PadR family transcriptional regulator, regulatory protein PadR
LTYGGDGPTRVCGKMMATTQRMGNEGASTVTAQPDDRPRRRRPTSAEAGAREAGELDAAPTDEGLGIASARDAFGLPIHRGWAPVAAHHRWLEPFVLMSLANGNAHGYAIVGALTEVGISSGSTDVGQVYRTLRDLEQAGQVASSWATGIGAARRDYTITELGSRALDEWAAVMKERQRLIAEFDAAYLNWVLEHPTDRKDP